ncbi:tetratricopeptide repeat protein [Candidatus Dependentiae bacterium]|nr:tetratricopeptide repeat protein [Candidatus Dependentiae bacterium]
MDAEKIYFQAIEYLNNKEYTLAIVSFSEALEKNYIDSKMHYYLAVCYANLKYYKETIEEISLALNEDLEFEAKLQLYYLKGYILFQQEKYDEALSTFKQILEFDDKNQMAISGIAYYYFKTENYQKAMEFYEQAYNISPDNPKVMNNYGYLMMINNGDLKKAAELCRKALDKKPENPAILDSVAWSSFLLDNIKTAALAITKAIKLSPNIEDIKKHYSSISEKVKKLIKK